jgi:hypothetical protein
MLQPRKLLYPTRALGYFLISSTAQKWKVRPSKSSYSGRQVIMLTCNSFCSTDEDTRNRYDMLDTLGGTCPLPGWGPMSPGEVGKSTLNIM